MSTVPHIDSWQSRNGRGLDHTGTPELLPFGGVARASRYSKGPPQRYTIARWVPEGEITSLFGAGGSLKSTLALLTEVCVASGIPFLDKYPVRQSPVLHLDFEHDRNRWQRRLYAICQGLGLKDIPRDIYYLAPTGKFTQDLVEGGSKSHPKQPLDEAVTTIENRLILDDYLPDTDDYDEEFMTRLVATHGLRGMVEAFGIGFIVNDSYSRAEPRSTRNPDDVVATMERLHTLVMDAERSAVMIDHIAKPHEDRPVTQIDTVHKGNISRGQIYLSEAERFAVEKELLDDEGSEYSTKHLILSQEKHQDGSKNKEPLKISFLTWVLNGGLEVDLHLIHFEVDETETDTEKTDPMRLILEALETADLMAAEIADESGLERQKVNASVTSLKREKKIVEVAKKGNAPIYGLPKRKGKRRRVTHCGNSNCGTKGLDSCYDDECSRCGWIICPTCGWCSASSGSCKPQRNGSPRGQNAPRSGVKG